MERWNAAVAVLIGAGLGVLARHDLPHWPWLAATFLAGAVIIGLENRRMTAILTRDMILKAQDVQTEEVPVPEWGGSVLVKGLTGKQRDEFETQMLERKGKKMVPNTANIRARLVARCMFNEAGQRILTDADANALGEHSAAAINRVYEVAARLSGISDEDVEELAEGFDDPSGDDSPSDSPAPSDAQQASYSTGSAATS